MGAINFDSNRSNQDLLINKQTNPNAINLEYLTTKNTGKSAKVISNELNKIASQVKISFTNDDGTKGNASFIVINVPEAGKNEDGKYDEGTAYTVNHLSESLAGLFKEKGIVVLSPNADGVEDIKYETVRDALSLTLQAVRGKGDLLKGDDRLYFPLATILDNNGQQHVAWVGGYLGVADFNSDDKEYTLHFVDQDGKAKDPVTVPKDNVDTIYAEKGGLEKIDLAKEKIREANLKKPVTPGSERNGLIIIDTIPQLRKFNLTNLDDDIDTLTRFKYLAKDRELLPKATTDNAENIITSFNEGKEDYAKIKEELPSDEQDLTKELAKKHDDQVKILEDKNQEGRSLLNNNIPDVYKKGNDQVEEMKKWITEIPMSKEDKKDAEGLLKKAQGSFAINPLDENEENSADEKILSEKYKKAVDNLEDGFRALDKLKFKLGLAKLTNYKEILKRFDDEVLQTKKYNDPGASNKAQKIIEAFNTSYDDFKGKLDGKPQEKMPDGSFEVELNKERTIEEFKNLDKDFQEVRKASDDVRAVMLKEIPQTKKNAKKKIEEIRGALKDNPDIVEKESIEKKLKKAEDHFNKRDLPTMKKTTSQDFDEEVSDVVNGLRLIEEATASLEASLELLKAVDQYRNLLSDFFINLRDAKYQDADNVYKQMQEIYGKFKDNDKFPKHLKAFSQGREDILQEIYMNNQNLTDGKFDSVFDDVEQTIAKELKNSFVNFNKPQDYLTVIKNVIKFHREKNNEDSVNLLADLRGLLSDCLIILFEHPEVETTTGEIFNNILDKLEDENKGNLQKLSVDRVFENNHK